MSVFTRIFRYLRALIMGKLDEWEDPELIINEAVREMRENQIKNRELAVQAITQKNNLQAEVDKQQRLVAEGGDESQAGQETERQQENTDRDV